ncbi:MAG: pentapeptide repeat-containing protein [Oscillospiraceae bacterium]|nr:pentapeptide repeat-containing protein [Oscillospiraceae bacterium]
MHNDFIALAIALRNEALQKTEASFIENMQVWLASFEKRFLEVCVEIIKAQEESIVSAISHMDFTILYTDFVNRRYMLEAWVYGEKWYLDKNQRKVGEYDISYLFVHFNELWDKLIAHRKRFIGKVNAHEVTVFMMQSLPGLYAHIVNIVRFGIANSVDGKPFVDIVKNDVFTIRVGDYMAKTEPVFTLKKHKNADTLANWFSHKLTFEYMFEDCSGLDFTSRDFSYKVFRYVQFRGTIFNDASLQGCSLNGASFRYAQMENCRLCNATVNEADFSYANLKNANLVNVYGRVGFGKSGFVRAGLPDEVELQHVGFLPVKFRNADLTGADLTWADLTGADFSGANLTGTNFSSAILNGAVFVGAILDGAIFNDTALDGVDFAGTERKGADIVNLVLDGNVSVSSHGGRTESMRYYVMEPSGSALLPIMPKGDDMEVIFIADTGRFKEIDFDARSEIISDRLKMLMELFMPKYDFEPIIFSDTDKEGQMVFWRFKPPYFEDFKAVYRNDGIISRISYPITNAPIVFAARSPKGVRSIVVRMAVAESAVRRGILGVKFTKIVD